MPVEIGSSPSTTAATTISSFLPISLTDESAQSNSQEQAALLSGENSTRLTRRTPNGVRDVKTGPPVTRTSLQF